MFVGHRIGAHLTAFAGRRHPPAGPIPATAPRTRARSCRQPGHRWSRNASDSTPSRSNSGSGREVVGPDGRAPPGTHHVVSAGTGAPQAPPDDPASDAARHRPANRRATDSGHGRRTASPTRHARTTVSPTVKPPTCRAGSSSAEFGAGYQTTDARTRSNSVPGWAPWLSGHQPPPRCGHLRCGPRAPHPRRRVPGSPTTGNSLQLPVRRKPHHAVRAHADQLGRRRRAN